MYTEKQNVIKITATKTKHLLKESSRKILRTRNEYDIAKNCFFKFLFDEIEIIRGKNNEQNENK